MHAQRSHFTFCDIHEDCGQPVLLLQPGRSMFWTPAMCSLHPIMDSDDRAWDNEAEPRRATFKASVATAHTTAGNIHNINICRFGTLVAEILKSILSSIENSDEALA